MTNYKREEFGPSGYSVVKQQQPLSQSFYHHQQQQSSSSSVLKSKSLSNFSHKIDHDGHEAIKKALPPLPSASTSTSSRPLIKERLSKAYDERPPVSRRTSQKYLANNNNNIGNGNNYDYNISAASSRRPSISGSVSNGYERGRTPRPYSTSYDFQISSGISGLHQSSGLRSVRSSPMRDMGAPLTASRRNSIVDSRRLPWPEPSPIRELPPQAPKIKIKHYPLPPPSYTEGMIAVSKRLRNRSSSPAPNYAELELSSRPALIPAAIGRPSPSREMIRMSMSGPPLKYNYGRYI